MNAKDYQLMEKAHQVAKEIQNDEYCHYRIALRRALKIVWNTLNRINSAKTHFTKEEKRLILSVLKPLNKFSGTVTLNYKDNAELINKIILLSQNF